MKRHRAAIRKSEEAERCCYRLLEAEKKHGERVVEQTRLSPHMLGDGTWILKISFTRFKGKRPLSGAALSLLSDVVPRYDSLFFEYEAAARTRSERTVARGW